MNSTQRARLRGVVMAYNMSMTQGGWMTDLGRAITSLAAALGEQAEFDKDTLQVNARWLLEDYHRQLIKDSQS